MARQWSVPGYTEVKVLGSGGFGEVVLARHDASGTLVAIKYLRRELLADPEFAAMFRGEAAVLASVKDRNVVRLYEYVEAPSGAAIVMELIDGVSLREILAHQGKTTAEAALVVLQGSLLGLAAAHRHGVVHRDYKPENVLVSGDGVSKLTDFGIAVRAGDRPMAAGTLAYAPPEQFGGGPASPSGDVYAATATFYECLTGHPPFSGDSAERMMWQHLAEPVPLEPVPEPLRPLVEAGMAKEPERRPADATALVTELRKTASWTYEPGWEERGRSHLGEAALLLAALWPSGGAPAAQGTTVQRISLRRRLPHRHVSAAKAAIAAGVAIAVVAVVVAVHTRPKAPAPAPALAVSGVLTGVAATSAGGAWAVGCAPAGKCTRTLILRWNGTTWTHVPSPSPGASDYLTAVAASSTDSAWAVGHTGSGTSARTLILRWNGTTWTHVPSPSPGLDAWLLGVTATSDGTAWATGFTESSIGDPHPLILRWSGTTWTQVPGFSPTIGYLYGAAAVSASSAWAFGYAVDTSDAATTLILRWNGTTWTRVASPNSGLDSIVTGMAAVSAGSAWAIGYTEASSPGSLNALLLRWNGTEWQAVPSPAPAGTILGGVAATSAGTAWAVGTVTPTGCRAVNCTQAVILQWNGTTWTRVPSPIPAGSGLDGVAALPGNNAVAVGGRGSKTLILRWNGEAWK